MNLIYTHDIFSVQQYGGISRYFSEIIRRIPPSEANVRVLAGLYINEYAKDLSVVKGLKVPSIPHTGFIRKKINTLFQKIMMKGSDEKTIIHQTYYYPFSFPKKFKMVVTVYDMIHELYQEHYPVNDDISRWKRLCCERADKIIAISHSTKNDLVRLFGVHPGKIAVIHLSSSLKDNVSSQESIPFHEPYLLFVGLRNGYKNFDGFIQAFAASSPLSSKFHVVCFGGGPFSDVESTSIKALGVERLVHQVSGSDGLLCGYYKHAAAYVCPSLYEGFGIPLLEAQEFSCPVICANTSSIPEVAGDAAVYFDPHDISAIRSTLEHTLFNEELLVELKVLGLKRKSMFSWVRCADETLNVYRSLLN